MQNWTLPVCFKADDAQQCQVVKPEASSVTVPTAAVFFANAGGKGYYRSAYAPAQYRDLVARAASSLTPPEQINLLGDEWALTHSNRAPVGDYLDLAAALKSDSNVELFSSAAAKIATIADKIASTSDERDALAAWIRRNYASEYAKLGPPAAGDSPNTRELRAKLLGLLVNQGDDNDLEAEARKIAGEFLRDPASIDPTLGQVALLAAARNGDAALFDRLQKVYENSSDPAVQENALRLLIEFRDPALLERGLEYSVSNKVRNQDTAIQLRTGLRDPENRDQVWQFIEKHWDAVQATLTTDLGAVMVTSTGSFCTAAARDDVKSFFAAHPVPASDVALRHALENIDGCIELRRLQEPNLKTWLAANGSLSN